MWGPVGPVPLLPQLSPCPCPRAGVPPHPLVLTGEWMSPHPREMHRGHPFFTATVERRMSPSPCWTHGSVTVSLPPGVPPVPVLCLWWTPTLPRVGATVTVHSHPSSWWAQHTRGHPPRCPRGHCAPAGVTVCPQTPLVPCLGTVSGATAPCPSCRPPPPRPPGHASQPL